MFDTPEHETTPRRAATKAPPGQLNLMALPEADVFLDGRRLGHTPLVGVRLPSGRHRVSLRTADGRRESIVVRVRPGQTTAVSHRFGD